MASQNMCSFIGFALAFALVAACFSGEPVQAQHVCHFNALRAQCWQFVLRNRPIIEPSAACCAVIHQADLRCVCSHMTPEVERTISMPKFVYIAARCGHPIPRGTRCGSYTVPLA